MQPQGSWQLAIRAGMACRGLGQRDHLRRHMAQAWQAVGGQGTLQQAVESSWRRLRQTGHWSCLHRPRAGQQRPHDMLQNTVGGHLQ